MPSFTREYPNGSVTHFRGGWGTLARLENVPRLPDERQRSYLSGKWEYSEDGECEKFVGFERSRWEEDEGSFRGRFCESDVPVLNRHSFNPRRSAIGEVSYPGKYYLAYGELMGGWYLL